jgi:tetratricopeptide (TPR) repeat protein
VYELILNLAEAGEFEKASALFHNRFFPREEGGTNVRQVWLEVQLQRAISLANSGQCSEAKEIVDHLAEPVPDLAFTRDGLEPFLRSARFSYLIGDVYRHCGQMDKAQEYFRRAAEQSGMGNVVWAWKASQELPGFDQNAVKQKLQSVLEGSQHTSEAGTSSLGLYNIGMLYSALDNQEQARKQFRQAFLAPDQLMAYHLTRLALASNR